MELPVAGRVFRVMEVPVPVHRVGRGEVIRQANVEMAKVPVNDIRPDTILASSELAGLEAVRVLRPGEPIRAADVRPEILVRKNSLVTVVLHAKGLQLSVQGKALDDGARGEAVRVMNTKSKRILEAEVEGPSMLSVGLAKFADAR